MGGSKNLIKKTHNKIMDRLKEMSLINALIALIIFVAVAFLMNFYVSAEHRIFAYMQMFLFFIPTCILVIYAEKQGANRLMVAVISTLVAVGILVQYVIIPINQDIKNSTVDAWAVKQVIIAFLSIGFIFVYMWARHLILKKAKKSALWIIMLASLVLTAVCCVLPEINGARNWVYIMGFSLQITEFIKLFGVVFMGELILSEYSDWTKFVIMTVYIVVTALALFVRINEMGTMIILGLVYLALTFNYLRAKWLRPFVSLVCIVLVGVFACGYIYMDSIACQWDCINECKVIATDEKGNYIKDEKGDYKYTDEILKVSGIRCPRCAERGVETRSYYKTPTFSCPKCFYLKFDYKDVTPDMACPVCSDHLLLGSKYGSKFSKIYQRFALVFSYDKCKEMDFADQIRDGLDAAKRGGFTGASEDGLTYIINANNDSVVAAVANRMGLIWVLGILLCYYILFLSVKHLRSPVKVSVILAFCLQALVTYLCNYNLFALTGIGVPFISSGGSIYMVSLTFAHILFTRDERYIKGAISLNNADKEKGGAHI